MYDSVQTDAKPFGFVGNPLALKDDGLLEGYSIEVN